MIVRHFDPTRDSYDELARMNEWEPAQQAWWAGALRARCYPQAWLVCEDAGRLVGAVMIFDGGLPFLLVDGAYLLPEYRTFPNGRALLQAIDAEARRRGVPLVFSHAPDRIGAAFSYYGYQRMNDVAYGLYGRTVPQET